MKAYEQFGLDMAPLEELETDMNDYYKNAFFDEHGKYSRSGRYLRAIVPPNYSGKCD